MALPPYLLSYEDPKIEKAYRRFLKGQSQRDISAALNIPRRTLSRRCKEGGWEDERKARRALAELPDVTPDMAPVAPSPKPAAPDEPGPDNDDARVDRMLRRQQRFCDRLFESADRASEELMVGLEGKPARSVLAQISQLSTLGDRLLQMQRKAYRVPDKIETKDTTPTKADEARKLTDEELDRRIAEAAGRTPPSARGEEASAGVN